MKMIGIFYMLLEHMVTMHAAKDVAHIHKLRPFFGRERIAYDRSDGEVDRITTSLGIDQELDG